MQEQFIITQEEKEFILKRRELLLRKNQLQGKEPPKDVILGANRPTDWDAHSELSKPHKGRLVAGHPLFKFEEEIFKKIGNIEHKAQHKLITELFGVPVQNVYRDRSYHVITHMDALWEQCMLPLKYKIWYEELKAKNGIDDTNVHPEQKKLKPDYNFPVVNKKRPWDITKYDCIDPDSEEFKVGTFYRYEYDDEVGYDFKKAWNR